ncbi:MAG: PKD domain-containing protein [Bacteroidales bacterium]|nr:PKD domain-containing protein [Bacteroidales bacterium]
MTTEDLYKNNFDGYRQDPPPEVWKGVNRRLAIKRFFKPGFGHFNILYVAAAAAISVGVLWPSHDDIKQPVQGNETITIADSSKDGARQANGSKPSYNENVSTEISVTIPRNNHQSNQTQPQTEQDSMLTADDIQADTGVSITSSEPEIQRTSRTESPMPYFTSAFYASQHQGCAPLTIQLQNLSQNTEYCQWSLGNGETSYEQNPSITFSKPGTYIIALRTVCGTYAKTSYDTIKVSAHQQAEIAVAISGMTIIAEARNVSGGNIVWDFGDKTQLMGKKHSHTYKLPGDYEIVLTISNNICTDTVTKRITIKEPEFSIVFPNAIIASRSGFTSGDYTSASPDNKALFGPKGNIDNLAKYNLTIYTRAGKQVFQTNNPRDTWNGYYLNELLPRGVYVYKCRYEFTNGESSIVNGNITLLWE